MIIYEVFSKRQRMIALSLNEIITMVKEEKIALRETNPLHVRRIKKYIQNNTSINEIYFPPLVATLSQEEFEKEKPAKITIIDGSTRLKALVQLETSIVKTIKSEDAASIKKGYKMLNTLEQTSFAFQLIEGLHEMDVDQLYIDLNTKGKKVALSKRISYDSRSILNRITNSILKSNDDLNSAGVELEKRSINIPKNKNLLSLSQLRQLVDIFIFGNLIHNKDHIDSLSEMSEFDYVELINSWFQQLFTFYPVKKIGNFHHSQLASFPMLVSIVLYANRDLKDVPFQQRKKIMIERMEAIKNIDWSRKNKVWREFLGKYKGKERYFYLNYNKSNLTRIVAWLEAERR